jgi:hypothetical protein
VPCLAYQPGVQPLEPHRSSHSSAHCANLARSAEISPKPASPPIPSTGIRSGFDFSAELKNAATSHSATKYPGHGRKTLGFEITVVYLFNFVLGKSRIARLRSVVFLPRQHLVLSIQNKEFGYV